MPKAFVMIGLIPGKEAEVQKQVSGLPGVKFAYQVTGLHDMIALIDAEPYEELAVLVATIRRFDGVKSTDTELVLR